MEESREIVVETVGKSQRHAPRDRYVATACLLVISERLHACWARDITDPSIRNVFCTRIPAAGRQSTPYRTATKTLLFRTHNKKRKSGFGHP
ncbi:hypothetical protein TcasGA2_TC005540 [Tribolium castaneum]|uniref:Uncharacterized protein n=1 Tax=Tribolium castaneum TaxID=7070 RepID=D6WXN4_TRICA|nr:hypothetical protein TcasGA2_TC005540 [Tribolium castaneum]